MKTVTKEQAFQTFDALGAEAHAGETIIVLDDGKPWIRLLPAAESPARDQSGKSAAGFAARLDRISTTPITGVVELLTQLRQ
jgi:antitoxin (DNA-binding transcriptional repressor) of toxin-antitoxin stability system